MHYCLLDFRSAFLAASFTPHQSAPVGRHKNVLEQLGTASTPTRRILRTIYPNFFTPSTSLRRNFDFRSCGSTMFPPKGRCRLCIVLASRNSESEASSTNGRGSGMMMLGVDSWSMHWSLDATGGELEVMSILFMRVTIASKFFKVRWYMNPDKVNNLALQLNVR